MGSASLRALVGMESSLVGNCSVAGCTTHDMATGGYSMPAVSDTGLVLAVLRWPSGGTLLHALELETGVQRWNVSINGTPNWAPPTWGSPLLVKVESTLATNTGTTAPAAAGELVVLGGYDGSVSAFDTETGARRWIAHTAGPVLVSAVTADPADPASPIWVGSWDHRLYKLERATGAVLGTVNLGTEVRSTPAIVRGSAGAAAGSGGGAGADRLYLSIGNAHVAIDGGATARPERIANADKNGRASGAVAAAPPTVVWVKNTTGFAFGSPTVLADGQTVLFPPSGDRRVWARDAATGAPRWASLAGLGCPGCKTDDSIAGALGPAGRYFVVGKNNPGNGGGSLFAFDTVTGAQLLKPQYASVGGLGDRAALTVDRAATVWTVGTATELQVTIAAANVCLRVRARVYVCVRVCACVCVRGVRFPAVFIPLSNIEGTVDVAVGVGGFAGIQCGRERDDELPPYDGGEGVPTGEPRCRPRPRRARAHPDAHRRTDRGRHLKHRKAK